MIDTHTHLYLPEFEEDRPESAVRRAIDAGVERFVMPNVDLTTLDSMFKLCDMFPDRIRVAVGLHPTSVGADYEKDLDEIHKYIRDSRCCAIGEVGIDLYWDKSYIVEQKKVLSAQIRWAEELDLPVIIHCREALKEVLEVISSYNGKLPSLLFHSFTGDTSDVKRIREVCDPYFGINGVVSFKNARSLRKAIPEIGINRILLETDSPYLAPVPHRGKRNESAFLGAIRDKIADTLEISPEEVERVTTQNARTFFNLQSTS